MKRPSDQAKLLMFYLFRCSAAALASTGEATALSQLHMNNSLHRGYICLRLARRTDVASIQRCNVATLPENYNVAFYAHHMHTWPDLAIVAEHVDPVANQAFRPAYPGQQPEPNIVAYVMGKVEERTIPRNPENPTTSPFRDEMLGNTNSHGSIFWGNNENKQRENHDPSYKYNPNPTTELSGHVTSIAVLHEYRRKGLGGTLLDQLHAHLSLSHGATGGVGLHVRQSNRAATNLYQNFGYEVHDCILDYYQDGEDAFYMKRDLDAPPQLVQRNRLWRGAQRPKPWEQNDSPWRLPRIVYDFEQKRNEQEGTAHTKNKNEQEISELTEEEEVVITGT